MRSEEIRGLMKALGAKRSEISIYLTLLRAREPLSVSSIVERTGLSDKTVRSALDDLIERGLVVKTGRGRGVKYRAKSVRTLAGLVKKRIEERVQELFTHLQFRSL